MAKANFINFLHVVTHIAPLVFFPPPPLLGQEGPCPIIQLVFRCVLASLNEGVSIRPNVHPSVRPSVTPKLKQGFSAFSYDYRMPCN